jgi:hypothetical protein
MSTQAATAERAARHMVATLLHTGTVQEALREARRQGIKGQLVVHVLAYADELATMIIDALCRHGLASRQVVSQDKAYQQEAGMPGCLLVVTDAARSCELITAVLPEACEFDVRQSIQDARTLGRIMLLVLTAGRVMGVMAEEGCGCAQCLAGGAAGGPGERERQRRAQRARRHSR